MAGMHLFRYETVRIATKLLRDSTFLPEGVCFAHGRLLIRAPFWFAKELSPEFERGKL